jgi:hypothetical protein
MYGLAEKIASGCEAVANLLRLSEVSFRHVVRAAALSRCTFFMVEVTNEVPSVQKIQ